MKKLLLVFLVACGGPPAPTTPARSPAVVELAGKADAVCACPDGECASDRFGELLERQAVLMTPGEEQALDAEHDRAVVCLADRSGRPRATGLVAAFGGVATRVCACAEPACAKQELEHFVEELKRYENAVFTSAEERQMQAHHQKTEACLARFPSPPEENPAVGIAETMADSICKCPDSDCAMEAARLGKLELDKVEAEASEADAVRIQAAGQKAAACMDALRGR